MNKKKILYAIVSVGLGNMSRTLAILEELPQDKYEISFIAQGHAYELLQSRFHTYKLEEIVYSSGSFNLFNIIRKNYLFPFQFMRNLKLADNILEEYKPDFLIVDSDFYSLHPAKKKGIPVISVNSSIATVIKFRQYRHSAFQNFFSFHFIERVDALLQKKYASLVICPVITKFDIPGNKYHQVNPIVRRQFLEAGKNASRENYTYDIAIMFGGSGIGANDIDLRGYNGKCLILGQRQGLKFPANAHCIEFTDEPARYLSQAKIIIVQGGFNSISEAIALRKPAIFVPIKNHAEQFANAHWAEKLGLGICCESRNILKAIEELESNYYNYYSNLIKNAPTCNGSSEAASLIEEFIDGSHNHCLR